MESWYAPRLRAERLVAAGRVVLAASSLFAVWLDPSEPAKHASIAYALLVAYLVYSAGLAFVAWWRIDALPRQGLLSHAFDLVFFSLFVYFTAGPSSPFHAFFVFALVCAALRWSWRATAWTAIASLTAFLGVGVYFGEVLDDPTFELHTFIIRAVYLGVVAVLLGYLGLHGEQTQSEISGLASWPPSVPGDEKSLLAETLRHAARVLAAERLELLWSEPEEPWRHRASWRRGELARRRDPPSTTEAPVAEELAGAAFLCHDLTAARPQLLVRRPAGFRRESVQPLHPRLAAELECRRLLALPVHGATLDGWLLILDKEGSTGDDLILGEVVCGLIAVHFDYFQVTQELRRQAATEERIRLARDLHDGVLQSMAGIALRLAAIRRLAGPSPEEAAQRLDELQRLIADEQRDLRFLIAELQPGRGDGRAADGLEKRLHELAERVEREWGIAVEVRCETTERSLPERLQEEAYLIVREGAFNAARHAAPSRVQIAVAPAADRVELTINDDGHGFPFTGEHNGPDLLARGRGPRSLCERSAALGGTLRLSSSPAGSSIRIGLPIAPSAGSREAG